MSPEKIVRMPITTKKATINFLKSFSSVLLKMAMPARVPRIKAGSKINEFVTTCFVNMPVII